MIKETHCRRGSGSFNKFDLYKTRKMVDKRNIALFPETLSGAALKFAAAQAQPCNLTIGIIPYLRVLCADQLMLPEVSFSGLPGPPMGQIPMDRLPLTPGHIGMQSLPFLGHNG
jgi:hypothetical protein